MVLRACLLAFQPLHVVLNPPGVALRLKAREGVLRRKEVHQAALGALPEQTHLPILCLLMAMLTVCQLSKLLAGLGAGDGLKRALEGLSRMGDHGLSLPPEDFFEIGRAHV